MNISKKWRTAAAGALALALVGAGTLSASAAEGDPVLPQPNGSPGVFYFYDGNTGELVEGDATRKFDRNDQLIIAASATDVLAEIQPSDYVPSGQTSTQIFKFITTADKLSTGTNGWNAFEETFAAGPNGGVLTDNFTAGDRNQGDINKVFTDGGDYLAGLAFTDFNGVAVRGAVYRTIHVEPGNTGKFTIDPVTLEGPGAPYAPNFANFSATSGVSAVIRNGNLNIDATVANAGKTVDVWAEGTGKAATVTLDATGKAINTVPAGVVNGTRLAIVENETEIAWVATSTFARTEPTDAADAATKVTIANPAEGSSIVTIAAGVANAGKTFVAVGWSTPTELGNVTADAAGDVVVDAAPLGVGSHTVALFGADDALVAWGTFDLTSTTTSSTDLTVDVATSNRFELSGVATSVDLGSVRRGQTTAPVALGAFTVIDDRDLLPGWTLNAEVADFINASANNDVIGKSALGLAPKQVGTAVEGVALGTAQAAGAGSYSALFAQGAADSSTLEAGTKFDADLTFAAPAKAKKGTYASTLTLTLASK